MTSPCARRLIFNQTRPTALTVNIDGIPNALRTEPRWLCWRYEPGHGRWAKIPRRPSGAFAKVNDPATWATFDQALAAYRAGRFDGVGFVLGDGWAGLDLDHCRSVADAETCVPPDASNRLVSGWGPDKSSPIRSKIPQRAS